MREKDNTKQQSIKSFLVKTSDSRHTQSTVHNQAREVLVTEHTDVAKSRPTKRLSDNVEDTSMDTTEVNGTSKSNEVQPKKNRRGHRAKMDPMTEMFRAMFEVSADAECRLRHSYFPAFNVGAWPARDVDELKNYPGCVMAAPRPVYVSTTHCDQFDICHRRTMAASHYAKLLRHTQTRYKTVHKNDRTIRNLQKKHIYHSSVFDMAERLERNPDPFFRGHYDYYYTGGNTCVLPGINDKQYVIHVDDKDLRSLNIGYFRAKATPEKSRLRNVCSKTYDSGSEIFEVMPILCPRREDEHCMAVRQRNTIFLEKLHSDGDRFKTMTEFVSSATPFIGMAQSATDPHIFVVSNMKQHLRSYDMHTRVPTIQKIYDVNEPNVVRSWNTVRAWREHTFVYANEKNLLLVDLRTTAEEWLKTSCGLPPDEFRCDYISSLYASQFKNLLYVGTHHKLHCVDVRHMKQHLEAPGGAISRWTHQMDFAPAFMAKFSYEDTEFLSIASPLAGDMRICELTSQKNIEKREMVGRPKPPRKIYKSRCLPFQPPTLQEAYESARLAGKCLHPDAELPNRIRRCTTGLAFYAPNELLLSTTSSGDVYAHTVSPRESQEIEERTSHFSDEQMERYAVAICGQTPPNLNYLSVVDMKPMSKVFRCPALNTAVKAEHASMEDDEKEKEKPHQRRLGRWQKSFETLHSFKDALVSNLLSIWDIEFKREDNLKMPNVVEEKLDQKSIVHNWLDTQHAVPPMLFIPPQTVESSPAFKINSTGVGNQSILDDLFDDTMTGLPQSTQYLDPDNSTLMDSSVRPAQLTAAQTTPGNKFRRPRPKTKFVSGF